MKRYKPALDILVEDPNGEWLRWEDHRYEFFRFTEIYEKRIRELKTQIGQECNCEEMAKGEPLRIFPYFWICPAHGYKRR